MNSIRKTIRLSDSLKNLQNYEINDLIDEYKLKSNHMVEFHYVIDPNDLQNYFFPRGLRDKDSRKEFDDIYIAAEALALNTIFTDSNTKIFVFDEYIPELIQFVNRIKRVITEKAEFNDIKYYRAKLTELISEFKINNPTFEMYLYTLFICQLDVIFDPLDKLQNLINERKLIINSSDLISSKLPLIFQRSFNINRPKDLYMKFYNKIKDRPGFDLTNTWTDCRAIDRIISINIHLEDSYITGKLDKRHVLLYLSSVKNMKDLFAMNFIKEDFPKINGKSMNIHRTPTQLLLKALFESDTNQNLLFDLKSIISNKGTSRVEDSAITSEIEDNINKLVEKYIIELLLIKYSNNYSSEESNDNMFLEKFHIPKTQLISWLNAISIPELIANSENTLSQIKIKVNFKEVYRNAIDAARIGVYTLSASKDIIKGVAQSFPLVFRHKYTDENAAILQRICAYILDVSNESFDTKNLIDWINSVAEEIIEVTEDNYENELIRLLLLQVLCIPKDLESAMIAYLEIENKISQNKAFNDPKFQLELYSDYLYLISWLARRSRNYSSALKYTEIGLAQYPQDPRFIHSAAMLKYCTAIALGADKYLAVYKNSSYSDKTKIKYTVREENKMLLQDSLDKFIISFDLYKNISSLTDNVEYVCCAIINSICYINLILYELYDKDIKYLNSAEQQMNNLKKFSFYINYPEYLHTESILYLEKYYIKFHIDDLNRSKELILLAKKISHRYNNLYELIHKIN